MTLSARSTQLFHVTVGKSAERSWDNRGLTGDKGTRLGGKVAGLRLEHGENSLSLSSAQI